jgi:hypothetical protein
VDDSRANKAKKCDDGFQYLFEWRRGATTSENKNVVTFDRNACQNSGSPCPGIDIDAVPENLGMLHGRVAVDNNFAVILRRVEEFVTNPEQIFGPLLLDRDAWLYSCMNEHKIAADEAVAKTLKEQFMRAGKHAEEGLLQIER